MLKHYMDYQELSALLDRYITGQLSLPERARLAELVAQPGHEKVLEDFVRQVMTSDDFAALDEPQVKRSILAHLDLRLHPPRRIPFPRYAAAAAILLVLAGGFWLWRSGRPAMQPAAVQQVAHDVAPGHAGAILTLADGKQIVLDSSSNGALARQGNTAITKIDAGELAYQAGSAATAEVMYNTLSTPRGRRSTVVLSDGTRVWLNAASSIKFPTAFTADSRVVEVSGEAYFEVAKRHGQPFIVRTFHSRPLDIQVLGTSFNISAYSDEDAVTTTLVEGAVRVVSGSSAKLLTPGHQLIANSDGSLELNPAVDMQKVIAWKEGNFLFRGDELSSIMRQLSRWYDIDVHFDGAVSDHYTGKISRQVNISQVLKMLQAAGGVEFSVQNKEVKVLRKAI